LSQTPSSNTEASVHAPPPGDFLWSGLETTVFPKSVILGEPISGSPFSYALRPH
jgi:hypothetical protein